MANELVAIDNSAEQIAIYGQIDSAITDLAERADKGNAQAMWENFIQYRDVCRVTGSPMFPGTAFMVMGLDMEEAKAIISGKLYQNNPDVQEVVRKAKMYSMSSLEQAYARGQILPSALIWYQKNFAGMSDFPEPLKVEVSELDIMTPQEIADKYRDILA